MHAHAHVQISHGFHVVHRPRTGSDRFPLLGSFHPHGHPEAFHISRQKRPARISSNKHEFVQRGNWQASATATSFDLLIEFPLCPKGCGPRAAHHFSRPRRRSGHSVHQPIHKGAKYDPPVPKGCATTTIFFKPVKQAPSPRVITARHACSVSKKIILLQLEMHAASF